MQLPLLKDFSQLTTRWKAILDPVIATQLLDGSTLKSVVLSSGANVVNHKLGRMQQGWIIVDQDGAASIYRSQPLNDKTLTLFSDAAVTVNLWVF